MAKEELYKDVPNLIMEHYDMFMDTRMTVRKNRSLSTLFIYSWIVFTPKEINEFTPKTVNFYSKHRVDILNDLVDKSYEDAVYIRGYEMPLLKYVQGEYYMDEFCEKLSNDKVEEIIEDYLKGKVNTKLIFTVGNQIYTNYYNNDF